MKIFNVEQIRAWDAYTIQHEPISSIDLMDRAARTFTDWFTGLYHDTERPVCIFCGTGNNGGDGLSVARLLHRQFYSVKVFVCDFSGKHSADFDLQLRNMSPPDALELLRMDNASNPFPAIPANAVVIDALFGSGLTRPLDGDWARLIDRLNELPNETVAIDLPSGLFADRPTTGPCIQANRTFSFEAPKLAFLFPENADRVGEWTVRSIGLHPAYAHDTATPFRFLEKTEVRDLVAPRHRFSHKGTYGHALLINGSLGKMGASVLSARACLRSGVGLLSLQTPKCGYDILQGSVPEAMCLIDPDPDQWTRVSDLSPYSAVGIGCGLGKSAKTAQALKQLLRASRKPVVLDADALNILSEHPGWLRYVPKGSILTPHPKEFERLFGPSPDGFTRNALLRVKAAEYGFHILLKGAFTAVAGPDGDCWFNSTGNPGMATGGSGDVLAGILTGLLAQGYTPRDTCLLGMYLHGSAGDLAAVAHGQQGLTAGDIADNLGRAWVNLLC